jgi:hypothetical protein
MELLLLLQLTPAQSATPTQQSPLTLHQLLLLPVHVSPQNPKTPLFKINKTIIDKIYKNILE